MNTHAAYLLGGALCLLLGAPSLAGAQGAKPESKQFSYISDRTFSSPDELFGYDFKPAMREVPGEEPRELRVGEYSFGITRKNLYVEGADIRGVYSLNEINTTEYGFILKTMNARDPTVQGHLKIVVDDIGQAEGLIFKRSTHDKEVIFFLRVIPPAVAEAEAAYFTHVGERRVEHIDSLWTGVEVRPFLRIFYDMGGIQQRILPSDSVRLNFYKVVTVEEKEKRKLGLPGKKRRGKRGGDPADAAEQAAAERLEPVVVSPERRRADSLAQAAKRAALLASLQGGGASTADTDSAAAFVEPPFDSTTLSSPFAASAVAVTELTPPRDSTPAAGSAAPAPSLDLAALAARRDSLAQGAPPADSLALAAAAVPPADTAAATDVKVKVTTEFFVDLRSFMRYDDGSSEMQHKTFRVTGIAERANPNARPGGDHYQWELSLHKRPNAYVYLDEKYRVNSISIGGQKFHMRGH